VIDKNFCCSSFLALRYVEKNDVSFTDLLKYNHPLMPTDENRIYVKTSNEISVAIEQQINEIQKKYNKIGIMLSGGMDSSILASYLPGIDAYTFRFMGGRYQTEELKRAEAIAQANEMVIHYVDISWSTVDNYLEPVMLKKGGPVHSIEPQIYQAAIQAKNDNIELMIIGDASDYIFGGMDKLLSKDWAYDEFISRYIYVNPFEVLKNPVSVEYIFEKYRNHEDIDFVKIIEELATQESYGSYNNAFKTAEMDYFDPYERLKLSVPLDLQRIRNGESKYLIRELFQKRYPNKHIPEKLPMPRPVDYYFKEWQGPKRIEFRDDIDINKYDGNQRWLLWCLEEFLNMIDKKEAIQ